MKLIRTYRTKSGSLIPVELYRQLKTARRELRKLIPLLDDLSVDHKHLIFLTLSHIDDVIPSLAGQTDAKHN